MSDIEYHTTKYEAKPRANRKREFSESEDEYISRRPREASKTVFYDSEEEHAKKSTSKTPVKKAKPSKRKSTVCLEKEANSEDEQVNKRASKSVKRPVKRKAAESREKRAQPDGWDLDFDDASEIEASRARSAPDLQSVLTRRVADGNLRRTATLTGDLFVELRLYNTKDIRSVATRDRWEKAVLSLKYQTDSDAAELDFLRQFIKRAREEFVEEGTFFPDKKK